MQKYAVLVMTRQCPTSEPIPVYLVVQASTGQKAADAAVKRCADRLQGFQAGAWLEWMMPARQEHADIEVAD